MKKVIIGIVVSAAAVIGAVYINDQITDSVTQLPNPNIERSDKINGEYT